MWYYTSRQNQQNTNMQSIICGLHNPFLCSFNDVFKTNKNGILMPWQIRFNAELHIYQGNQPPATLKSHLQKKRHSAIRLKTTQQLILRLIRMPASLPVTQSVAFVNFQMAYIIKYTFDYVHNMYTNAHSCMIACDKISHIPHNLVSNF